MLIRTSADWEDYFDSFGYLNGFTMPQVPNSPPSYPCIVTSLELCGEDTAGHYINHSFYTVEDYEKPSIYSEFMPMLEDYPAFVQAVEEDLVFRLIEDSSNGV